MKKRLLQLWFLSMLILLSACSKGGVVPPQPDASSGSVPESNSAQAVISEAVSTAGPEEAPLPSSRQNLLEEAQGPAPDFLDAEQQTLYRMAKTAYIEFALDNSGFGSTGGDNPELEKDDMQYYKCNGSITEWEAFEDAMLSVFTPEYFEELNNMASYTDGDNVFHKRTIFAENNGGLYYSGGARGGDISFVEPETFELASQNDNEIQFYVVGTYDDFAYDKDGNLIEGEDGNYKREGNPTQEKRLITMKKGSDGWRFSEFQLPY